MSIASRIEQIEQHLTDDYNVLELAGADLTNIDKNIFNLKASWKERLLYFMNNGTDIIWNNWKKVNGTGTNLLLNNTEKAPMKIELKGNTTQDGTPTPSNPVNVNVVTGGQKIKVGTSLVPADYTQVDYIESNGTQYIDTGVVANNDIEFYIDFLTNSPIGKGQHGTILGARKNYKYGYQLTTYNDTNLQGHFLFGTNNTVANIRYNAKITVGERQQISFKNHKLYLSDGTTTDVTSYDFNTEKNIYLFACNESSAFELSKTRIYNLKLYNENTLIRDFIPCYRNSDNEIGLYDLVNNVFYENQGTNSFTYGEVVDDRTTYEINLGKNFFDINQYSNAILRASGNNVTLTKENDTTLKLLNKVSSSRNYCGIPILNSSDLLGNTITVNADITINGNTDTAFQFWFMNSTSLLTEIGTAKKITSNGNQTYTATIPSTMSNGATGIAIMIYGSFDSQAEIDSYVTFNKIQIEKGSVATTFASYKTPIELCKIEDYQDYIYKNNNKWYIEKKIGKYICTGNETLSLQNSGKRIHINSSLNSIPEPLHTPSISTKYGMYSNKLVEVTAGNTWNGIQGVSYDYNSGQNTGNIDISINGISTLADYKTAIVGIIIYYILQTPTTIEITDTELINQLEILKTATSYDNQTNISQENNNLPFIINATALMKDSD